MGPKWRSNITLRPLIVRRNACLELDQNVRRDLESQPKKSIGLALAIKETQCLESCKLLPDSNPNVMAYISEQVETEEEGVVNYLIVISHRLSECPQLFLGFWMISGAFISDLRIIRFSFDSTLFDEKYDTFFQQSTIRGILVAGSGEQNDSPGAFPDNREMLLLNQILPVRRVVTEPKDSFKFLRGILAGNLLTHRNLNGLKLISYFQAMCGISGEVFMKQRDAIENACCEKALENVLESSRLNIAPQVEDLHLSQYPFNKALQLRLELLNGALCQFGIWIQENITPPRLPQQELPLNLDQIFQKKFNTQSQFRLFEREFNLSVKKIQQYKTSKIKGASTEIEQGHNSIIEKLEEEVLEVQEIKQVQRNSFKVQENSKTTKPSLEPSQLLQSYQQSQIEVRHQYPQYRTVELVQSVPIYEEMFTADRFYTSPQPNSALYQPSSIPQYSTPAPRKLFQCCTLI